MNKVLYIILISLFSFTVISCSEDKEESTTDTTAPVIAEVTAVTTTSTDFTPDYTRGYTSRRHYRIGDRLLDWQQQG